MTLLRNVDITAQDTMSIDAFGRWRSSDPYTVFDSKQIFDNGPLYWDDQEVSGSATSSTYSQPFARSRMLVAASTAGKRVRQTKMRFNYQPGKSQLILLTSRLSAIPTGVTASVGLFDDDNGVFFSVIDGVMNAVIRSSTSGSAVDTAVPQTSWNKDTMDGNGPSGVTIDPTKGQIMFIDMEWLGLGRCRMGFVIGGLFIVAHEFLHANSVTGVYMSTPNLPLRYSIENDGTAAETTLDHICSTVISEGGIDPNGQIRYISTAGAEVATTTENVIYAVVGLKLKAANLGATIDIIGAAIQIQTVSEMGEWTLRLNPTVAGTFTYSDVTNSSLQRALGATANTVTGGTILQGGFGSSSSASGGGSGTVGEAVETAIRLGSLIDGTADQVVLCWMPVGGTSAQEVEGSLTVRELS
jgi:hypothetical protein